MWKKCAHAVRMNTKSITCFWKNVGNSSVDLSSDLRGWTDDTNLSLVTTCRVCTAPATTCQKRTQLAVLFSLHSDCLCDAKWNKTWKKERPSKRYNHLFPIGTHFRLLSVDHLLVSKKLQTQRNPFLWSRKPLIFTIHTSYIRLYGRLIFARSW